MEEGSRVTTKELYEAIDALRTEMRDGFESLRLEMRSYAPKAVCEAKHAAIEVYIESAIKNGSDDRQKLWEKSHDIETDISGLTKKVYMGVGAACLIPTLIAVVLHDV